MKRYIKLFLFSLIIFAVGLTKAFADENIELVKVELQEKSDYVEINEEVSLEDNKIISNVNFYDEGDYIIYKLTFKNNGSENYIIKNILDNNNSEYLKIEYTYDELFKANSEKEVLLKITYRSLLPYDAELTPENEFNAINEISISMDLEEEIKNPNTIDNILIVLSIGLIALVSYLVLSKRIGKRYLSILLIGILVIPKFINAKLDFHMNFNLKNTMHMKVNFLDQYWKDKVTESYTKIEFVKEMNFPVSAIDVSQKQDESIKAWVEDDTVYIGSKYRIFFPTYSSYLLSKSTITEIQFNDRIDTTFVIDMRDMFYQDKFEEINVSSYRTGNVTDISYMFYSNANVKKLDLSNFDTSKVTDISYITYSCPKLEELIIDNWDLSNLEYGRGYSFDYNYLKSISAKNLIFPSNSSDLFKPERNTYLESIDLSGSDASNVTNMYELFYGQSKLKELKGIEEWNTSKVTNMAYAFTSVSAYADGGNITLDLSGWDISNVEQMYMTFYYFGSGLDEVNLTIDGWTNDKLTSTPELFRAIGRNAKKVNVTIKNLNLSKTTAVDNMFLEVGGNAEEVNLEVDGLSFESLKDTHHMFETVGDYAGKVKLTVNNVYMPSVTNVWHLFDYVGMEADEVEINVSNWEFRDLINATEIFYYAGRSTNKTVFNCSNWNIPNATSTSMLFYGIGAYSGDVTFNISDINAPLSTNGSSMFKNIGARATNMATTGINTIDLSKITNMYNFFESSFSATDNIVDLGTIDIYANDISYAFHNTKSIKATINLHTNPSSYMFAFSEAATTEGSEIIVNYTADVTNIDAIINTKGTNSNVIKGSLIED